MHDCTRNYKKIYRKELNNLYNKINMWTGIEYHFDNDTIKQFLSKTYLKAYDYYEKNGQVFVKKMFSNGKDITSQKKNHEIFFT